MFSFQRHVCALVYFFVKVNAANVGEDIGWIFWGYPIPLPCFFPIKNGLSVTNNGFFPAKGSETKKARWFKP